MSFRYSSADHARTVRVRTLPNELTASANLVTLSPLGASTKMMRHAAVIQNMHRLRALRLARDTKLNNE